jgi:outer membrane lipoprotein-sorting protein
MKTRYLLIVLMLAGVVKVQAEDALERIEQSLAAAGCCQFTFLSIVESGVFETVDTARGNAYLAKDGRYCIRIGDDLFVYDNEFLRSYSASQNQVTVERVSSKTARSEEISFLTHLSDFYRIRPLKADREYFLTRIDSVVGSIPDSLRVFVSKSEVTLDSLKYYDFNGDLNHIVFLNQETLKECREDRLAPAISDSAEVIKLY